MVKEVITVMDSPDGEHTTINLPTLTGIILYIALYTGGVFYKLLHNQGIFKTFNRSTSNNT